MSAVGARQPTSKSFLFLFFKKEILPFYVTGRTPRICAIAYVKSGLFNV
jgi:hypothetical protein